jgi:DNA processing protein
MPNFPIRQIFKNDADYPPVFAELHDPPKSFYCRGEAGLLTRLSVAVVGTRRASEHGLVVARDFCEAFARAGLVVVSGLAYGIDAAAHEGALAANGKTIAILGSGIDDETIYPRGNFALAKRILENGGAIISENPANTKPQQWDFPKRNRLIAAIAPATVIVEAPEKSGAIITAKYALELGRDVFVVPADALRESALGSNRLIVDGAPPLLSPDEIIKKYVGEQLKIDAVSFAPHNHNEALIIAALKKGTRHADELATETKLPAAVIMSTLTALELQGAVTPRSGGHYALRHGA